MIALSSVVRQESRTAHRLSLTVATRGSSLVSKVCSQVATMMERSEMERSEFAAQCTRSRLRALRPVRALSGAERRET
jgi:hypothetical protein